MANLISLPTELLARIIAFTIPGDFEAVMMTCKRCYEAGEIYRAKHNRLAKRYRCFRFGTDIRSTWDLLTAIAEEPVIAEYIETAYLYNDGNWFYPDETGEYSTIASQPPGDTSQKHLIKGLLHRSRYPLMASIDENEWLEGMVNGVENEPQHRLIYTSTVLLTLLPNITAFAPPRVWSEFFYDSDQYRPLVDVLCSVVRFANTDAGRDGSLSKLAHLYPNGLEHGYDERMGLEYIGPLFALPSMRTVSAASCIASEDANSGITFTWPIPGLTSPVESIELYASVLEDHEPEKLLTNTSQLRSFRMSHETKWHGCGHDWEPHVIFDTLERCCGQSLTDLSVTITGMFGDLLSRVTSFKGFVKLEHLELDVRLLAIPSDTAGVDGGGSRHSQASTDGNQTPIVPCLANILPQTIQTVRIITACDDGIAPEETPVLRSLFADFREHAQTKLPNLQWVRVIRGMPGDGMTISVENEESAGWPEVKDLIESQGCEFEEVERARAAWLTDFFRRFPYLDENYEG